MCLKVHSVLCHSVPHLFSMELYFVKTFLGKLQAFSSVGWCATRASTVPLPARRFSVMCNSVDGSWLPRSIRPARVCLNCRGLGRVQSNVNWCTKMRFHHEATVWMTIIGHNSYMGVAKLRCGRLVLSSAIFISVSWLAPMPETVPLFRNNIAINSYSIYMQIFLCKLKDAGIMKWFWWNHLVLEEQMSTRCLNLAELDCLFA